MNEIVKNNNLQTVNKDLLKDWIEEMDAGKWHRNIQISHNLYDVRRTNTLSEPKPEEGEGITYQVKIIVVLDLFN